MEAVLTKYHHVLIGGLFVNLINSLTEAEGSGSRSGRGPRTLARVCLRRGNGWEMPGGDVWLSLTFL